MKTFISSTLLFGLFLGGQSAIFRERQPEIPGHPGECYDTETNTFYKEGEEMIWRYHECGRKLCRGSYGENTILAAMETCGKLDTSTGCSFENQNEPYPNCCRVVCPEINKENNFLDGKAINK